MYRYTYTHIYVFGLSQDAHPRRSNLRCSRWISSPCRKYAYVCIHMHIYIYTYPHIYVFMKIYIHRKSDYLRMLTIMSCMIVHDHNTFLFLYYSVFNTLLFVLFVCSEITNTNTHRWITQISEARDAVRVHVEVALHLLQKRAHPAQK